jgi:hypothetical protein
LACWIFAGREENMRAAIIAAAAFALLSACANHRECLDGAGDAVKGSGEGAFFVFPFALVAAGVCVGITAAVNDSATADAADKPNGAPDQVPAPGSTR